MFRVISASLSLAVLVFAVWAQAPKADVPAEPKGTDDIRKPQEQNAKVFKDLTRKLLELAVKLDKSDKPEDKDRAKTIRAALEVAEKSSAETQFRNLIAGMSGGTRQLQDVEKLIGQDEELTKTLLEMLTILMTDDETARLKAEIARLEKFLKEAEELKRRQELLRTRTDSKKGNPKDISENQKDLAGQTKDLANRMGGGKSDSKGSAAESKSEPKASDPKDADKASEPKGDSQGAKSDSKDGDAKAAAAGKPAKDAKPKGDEPKPGEPKGEAKPSPKEAKPGEPSARKSQGDGKGDAKPSDGQKGEGKPMGAKSGGQPSSSEPKGGGQSGGGGQQPPQPPQPQNPNQTPGRKNVEEAYPHQKGAEEDASKDKRPDASKKMDKAVEELAKAIEEMKKRLKQLREEELLKLLANLEARCNRMLAMQIDVYENTKSIDAGVKKSGSKTNADIQKSQQQADKEKEIVAEAEKTLKLLETEGSAVAFARVLEEVMGDMQAVQVRLEKAYVEEDTQTIEANIIAMLKEMVAALKKQQQEMQNNKNNPNNNNSKPNQKLIDQLAELKLIRVLQNQVNIRTSANSKKYDGEQAMEAIIQGELKQLAQRQAKLQDMIQKIATQANQ